MHEIHRLKHHRSGHVQTFIVHFALGLPDVYKLLPSCPHKLTCWNVARMCNVQIPACATLGAKTIWNERRKVKSNIEKNVKSHTINASVCHC